MDITPFLHALCAVAAQVLVGLFTGNWAYGAIAGCTFFIAREHTQAEYRWIEMFGHGKRMNMRGGAVLIRARGMWQALWILLYRWWRVCWSGCWFIVGEKR